MSPNKSDKNEKQKKADTDMKLYTPRRSSDPKGRKSCESQRREGAGSNAEGGGG